MADPSQYGYFGAYPMAGIPMMPGMEQMMMPSLMQQPPTMVGPEGWYGMSAEDMWGMGIGGRYGGKGGRDLAALSNSHCRYWRFGRCARGETCFYKHDLAFLGVDRPGSNGVPLPAPPPGSVVPGGIPSALPGLHTAAANGPTGPGALSGLSSALAGIRAPSMASNYLKQSLAAGTTSGTKYNDDRSASRSATSTGINAHGGPSGTTPGPLSTQFLDFNSSDAFGAQGGEAGAGGGGAQGGGISVTKNKDGESPVAGGRRFKGYVQSYSEDQGCGFIAGDEVTQFFGTNVFLGLDQVTELTGDPNAKLSPGVRLSFSVIRSSSSGHGQPKARDLRYEHNPEIQVDPSQAKIEADIARFKDYVAEAEGRDGDNTEHHNKERSRSRSRSERRKTTTAESGIQ